MELDLEFIEITEEERKAQSIVYVNPESKPDPVETIQVVQQEPKVLNFIGRIRFGRKVATQLEIGDKVKASPVGPGIISGFNLLGKPRVKNVAVDWLERDDGLVYDPKGRLP